MRVELYKPNTNLIGPFRENRRHLPKCEVNAQKAYAAQWASGGKNSAFLPTAFNTENLRRLPPISRSVFRVL